MTERALRAGRLFGQDELIRTGEPDLQSLLRMREFADPFRQR